MSDRPRAIKFGGWYDGDNHKPGRGWYFICRCGKIGLGQLLPASALRAYRKHARRCPASTEGADE